jgi:uncharacterized protein (TIGR02246 family)
MQKFSRSSLLLAALLMEAPAHRAAAQAGRLDQSILDGADTYRKAVLAGDAAAVAATYRDDAVELPPCRPAVKGRAEIERYYHELFQSPMKVTPFTFSYLEATVVGNTGYAAGTYERQLSGGSASISDSGKFIVVVKRTGQGWKTAYVIYNGDRGCDAPQTAAVKSPRGFRPAPPQQ